MSATIRSLLILAALVLGSPMAAQEVFEPHERLGFERPESWAMAYLGASTLFSGLGVPDRVEPGSVRLGVELGHIPRISTERRRVGLHGTKLEDLNKSPVFGRARLHFGLPADVSLELAWTPPVRIGGARAERMAGIALERPWLERPGLRAGWRLYYHTGSVSGDITCDRQTAALPPGSPGNPFGCQAPSDDTYEADHRGAELSLATTVGGGRFEPYLGLALSRFSLKTRNDAHVFNIIDRTIQETRGTTRTLTLGMAWRPPGRWEAVAAVAWTPLNVRRTIDADRSRDDLWSVRLMAMHRFR